jgi:D-alanyl-D-alanine carboxypeptidase
MVRHLTAALAVALAVGMAAAAQAAPRVASFVMDARNGAELHAVNADERLHPASLTKMMTLYLVFEAVQRGRLSLDQTVTVSRAAAGQPPSKMGFRAGQTVPLRDLIRSAAIRSANDSAVVLAEAVAGTEARFAELMTRRARELGMTRTTFRNASGLTAQGHLSTARDMAVLGRRLLEDFPQYYNLFGRQTAQAHGRTISNTNRLLTSYRGADGIKTGYTRAAGFNLVSSAERGNVRVIVAYFGGSSGAQRNARVAELMDLGFARAPARPQRVPAASLVASAGPAMAAPPTPRPGAEDDAAVADLLAEGARALGAALTPAAAQAAEMPADRRAPAPRLAALRSAPPTPRPGSAGGWSLRLGAFAERELAIANLAAVAFGPMPELAEAGRDIEVARRGAGSLYRARLTGLDAVTARQACAMIAAEGRPCEAVAPSN